MSAICGIFGRTNGVNRREAEAVFAELGKYRFDAAGSYHEDPVFLGCHINRVVPESLHEALPYEDRGTGLVIAADAVLYNREELFRLLSIPDDQRDMPDSRLIMAAYQKWGTKCPEKLVGDFAFAIWDKYKNKLFCARDHTGNRTLYYCHSPELFAFSTLMEPLFKTQSIKKVLNGTYIADFLSIASVLPELGDEMTIYENILNLPPASAMLVGKNSMKKMALLGDTEYQEAAACRRYGVRSGIP